MVKRVQAFFQKHFRKSFFQKIFLVYVCVTVATGSIMLLAINKNLVSIKKEQALLMSDQINVLIEIYLKDKFRAATRIHQQLYQNVVFKEFLTNELKTEDGRKGDALFHQKLWQTVVKTVYETDSDFNGLFIGRLKDGMIYQFGSTENLVESRYFQEILKKKQQGRIIPDITSARTEKSPRNAFSLFLFQSVKSLDLSCDIGYMGLYFNAMNIQRSYQAFEPYLKGNLLVLNEAGDILFESGANYEIHENFPKESILIQKNNLLEQSGWIINTLYCKEFGYYVVNQMPVSTIYEDVRIPLKTMVCVLCFSTLIALMLIYISTRFFAKRLQPIMSIIKQVRRGNLTSFPIQKKYDDELGLIYTELLRMCASLDEHIKKEYVYQLRQKEMELYTLQAQIDPHFLYNTLEAIRMKLYIKGETEASKMIWILSDLFRNVMRKDAVILNRDELHYLNSYLELFSFRLGDGVKFSFDVEAEVYQYATIKQILQPIVENALVHGVEEAEKGETPCTIQIVGKKVENDIFFEVIDDGCGMSEEKLEEIRNLLDQNEHCQKSIGLYNVNSRLEIVYGSAYRLKIESEIGKGTKVIVKIRAMKKKELEKYVQTVNCG